MLSEERYFSLLGGADCPEVEVFKLCKKPDVSYKIMSIKKILLFYKIDGSIKWR